jgi:uncharacterized membrane-anchored protein
MYRSLLLLVLVLPAAGWCLASADAQTPPPSQVEAELKAAWADAEKTAILGPAEVKLLDQATIKIPADQALVPAGEANRIMAAMGNRSSPARFGIVVSRSATSNWFIDVVWVKEGYVRDGDAKEWEADALLESLKQGTEQGNIERLARGIPAIDVVGWIERPAYESSAHRLVWSLALKERGASVDLPQTVNYNTYALGREGYFSLDLVTSSDSIAVDKSVVHGLLDTLTFVPGKRYEEFDSSTDKVAAYGLAALIGGVAVKKLGLLAVIGIFLLKIWKLGLVILIGAGAAFRRFFKRSATPDKGV